MNTNPYQPPNRLATPRRVIVQSPENLVNPRQCVVCGSGEATFVSYCQEHSVMVFGARKGIGVSLPYCEEHARLFRRGLVTVRRVRLTMLLFGLAAMFGGGILSKHSAPTNRAIPALPFLVVC